MSAAFYNPKKQRLTAVFKSAGEKIVQPVWVYARVRDAFAPMEFAARGIALNDYLRASDVLPVFRRRDRQKALASYVGAALPTQNFLGQPIYMLTFKRHAGEAEGFAMAEFAFTDKMQAQYASSQRGVYVDLFGRSPGDHNAAVVMRPKAMVLEA